MGAVGGGLAATRIRDASTTGQADGEVAIFDQQLRSRFEWLREPDPDAIATPQAKSETQGTLPMQPHPYLTYGPIQISLVEVKLKGEPLGDALSA